MPIYKYKASSQGGRIVEAEKAANTKEELIQGLHLQGLMVISIEEKVTLDFKKLTQIQVGGIPLKEKVFFVKQLAAMLKAGLPIIQSLEIMLDQSEFPTVRAKLGEVYRDIQGGLPLAKSFRKQNLIFDELQLSLIEAGEQSGNMIEIMEQIAIDLQKKHQLNSKIKGALIYPVIVIIVSIVVVILLVIFMVPGVESLYADLGAEDKIPAITKMLVSFSDFITNPFGVVIVIISILATILGLKGYYKTDSGRKVIDKFQLRMPIFGNLITKIQVLQMVRLMELLVKSGIPIIDALNATANSLGNIHFRLVLQYAGEKVASGSPIAPPLAKNGVVPQLVVKMIATGEDTGSLDSILKDLTEFYEAEVEEMTSNLTKLMEPLMLLVVGSIVIFLALAVYIPMYGITEVF